MNRVVFLKGYVLNDVKYNLKKIQKQMIKKKEIFLSIDNHNDYIVSDVNYDQNYFNKVISESVLLNKCEYNEVQVINDKYLVWLYPIKIKYNKIKELKLNISLRLYKNNTMITTIEIDSDYDIKELQKILELNVFERIYSDNELYNNIFNSKSISFFEDLFSFIAILFNGYFNLSVSFNRYLYVVDKKELNNKEIYQILYVTDKEFKKYEELRDFRCFNDYYLYAGEISSVIFGSNIVDAYYNTLVIEYQIIYYYLDDFIIYNSIKNNNYSLNKLYDIKESYLLRFANRKYCLNVENNEYMEYIFNLNNKYSINDICNIAIDKKIEKTNIMFQIILTVLGLIISLTNEYTIKIIKYIIKIFKYLIN